MVKSSVTSPLAILACVNRIIPFVSDAGVDEIRKVWGTQVLPSDRLNESDEEFIKEFNNVVDRVVKTVGDIDDVKIAAELFSRLDSVVGGNEVDRDLVGKVYELPANVSEAQKILDKWTKDNTGGMIEKAPVTVEELTMLVAASAIVLDSHWAVETVEDTHSKAFFADAGSVYTAGNDETVMVTIPLQNGLVVGFWNGDSSNEDYKPLSAEDLLETDWTRIAEDSKFFKDFRPSKPCHFSGTPVHIPEFDVKKDLDLIEEAEKWGISEAVTGGLPKLHRNAKLSEAKTSSVFSVTSAGVHAASVAMFGMVLRAAVFTPPPAIKAVDLSPIGLSYGIWAKGCPVPLFVGITAGR